jgi:ribosomal protein L11 methylase PrmA
MTSLIADPGSFRDPSGRVHRAGDRTFRTIGTRAAPDYEAARDQGILKKYSDNGFLVDCLEIDPAEIDFKTDESTAYVVEHSTIPFVSYPYEWSFSLLKKAALFHLDFQSALLDDGFVLSDATAYNVQFQGAKPIFIDLLSIRKYREGEYWLAHQQFCEQFLNPLLLGSHVGIPHNDWFRGRLEGIPSSAVVRMLPFYKKLSFRMLSHVVGPARLQARSERRHTADVVQRPLSRSAYRGLQSHLRRWIQTLQPAGSNTKWQDYEEFHSYTKSEEQAKMEFVGQFVSDSKAKTVWDIGCNTGVYSEVALRSGADTVVGFDFDHGALDRAVYRAESEKLSFLPVFLDGANPSPDQGWAQKERMGLSARGNADAIVALAFIHHLAIGKNIPLGDAVAWLMSFSRSGLIEYVQKDDPTVLDMLALREDIFDQYTEANFVNAIESRARITSTRRNPDNGRILVVYERNDVN